MSTNNTRAAGGLFAKNRRSIVFTLILGLMLALGASPALAQFAGDPAGSGGGGFSGPGPSGPMSVKQARDMHDDTWVTLRGHISRSLGGEQYEFKDSTGTISVEIDHHLWGGQTFGPNDQVEINGEVDRDWSRVEIDVKSIRKL